MLQGGGRVWKKSRHKKTERKQILLREGRGGEKGKRKGRQRPSEEGKEKQRRKKKKRQNIWGTREERSVSEGGKSHSFPRNKVWKGGEKRKLIPFIIP